MTPMGTLADTLPSLDGFCSLSPATPEQIDAAQEALGLAFSDEYRAYLLAYGSACVGGHELTGLCDSKRLSVVAVTQDWREADPEVPADWYVVEELGVDDYVAWQDAAGKVFLKRPGTRATLAAPSLLAYL